MLVIVAVLGTLLLWTAFWFVRFGGIQMFQARAAQRKEEARRQAAREATLLAPLRAIDDPRDAAAILMVLIARHNGDPTREQIALIESKLKTVFGFERELPERMAQARFIASKALGFAQAAGVYAAMFNARLTRDERHELVDMLEEVASHDGPSEQQIEAISWFKPKIGVASGAADRSLVTCL